MRILFTLMCVLALGVMGCSETSGAGGSGGTAGEGGSAGDGGFAGIGGSGGDPIIDCLPTEDRCVNETISPHQPCCEQEVPDQANACDGTESTENPTTCTATGNTVTHRLTLMELEGDCNVGYDLDSCEGQTCVPSGLTPAEGMSGVDNALAGFAVVVGGIGVDIWPFNQALSDMLCGATDDLSAATCHGGSNDGESCSTREDCPGDDAWCVRYDHDCQQELEVVDIRFVVDANPTEGCANVTVLADGEASAHVLNLSDDGCASGTLGPLSITVHGFDVPLGNTVVRMTVSPAGFSDGLLGAVMDVTEVDLLWLLVGGRIIGEVPLRAPDINMSTPPVRNASADCNGLSATFVIGGIAE